MLYAVPRFLLTRLGIRRYPRCAAWGTVRTDDNDVLRLVAFRRVARSAARFAHAASLAIVRGTRRLRVLCTAPYMSANSGFIQYRYGV